MTVKSVVTKFGGQSALARRIGRRPSVVAYWVKASTIPSRWHPVLLQIAAAEGIYLTANELVAQDEPKEVLTGTVLPVAKYPGSFRVENFTINCYVLNDGRRI
ncbi:MAG: hypothetical protein H0V13_09505, partial [Nocardioidaceae bacterium]|nr:hypothetical protein [Nocardioidaceae bacterium]